MSSTEGSGGDNVRAGSLKRVNGAAVVNRLVALERSICTRVHVSQWTRDSGMHTCTYMPSLQGRKMEADISGQFFVRNIHLHEEKTVKNLICKAIWRVDSPWQASQMYYKNKKSGVMKKKKSCCSKQNETKLSWQNQFAKGLKITLSCPFFPLKYNLI